MSKLSDLKALIGSTVYLRTPIVGPFRQVAVREGTLIRVDGETCVVEWDECLCLSQHGPEDRCDFRLADRTSIFNIQADPPSLVDLVSCGAGER